MDFVNTRQLFVLKPKQKIHQTFSFPGFPGGDSTVKSKTRSCITWLSLPYIPLQHLADATIQCNLHTIIYMLHQHGRTCQLQTEGPGWRFLPTTFLLWGASANHWATVARVFTDHHLSYLNRILHLNSPDGSCDLLLQTKKIDNSLLHEPSFV